MKHKRIVSKMEEAIQDSFGAVTAQHVTLVLNEKFGE